jgi:hypothetical protein
MVILIPIKIDHGKPITKVKVRTRIVIKMRTLVGSGYYNIIFNKKNNVIAKQENSRLMLQPTLNHNAILTARLRLANVYDLTFSSTEESMLTSQHLNCSNHLHPLSTKQILPISFYHTIRTNNIIHLYQRLSTFRHLTKAKCLYTSNPTTNAKCIC